jgi:hypothetical protein
MKTIVTQSWAGLRYYNCEIISETAKRFKVRLLCSAWLPGNRRILNGAVVFVPKYAVVDTPSGQAPSLPWTAYRYGFVSKTSDAGGYGQVNLGRSSLQVEDPER